MKKQAKLYKEYQEWIKKQNKKSLHEWKRVCKIWEDGQTRLEKSYKMRLKKWRRNKQKEESNYKSLPWYKRVFMVDPRDEFGFGWINRPRNYSSFALFPFFPFTTAESHEGFMNWLVEKKYKL